jgi:hypothetical protein
MGEYRLLIDIEIIEFLRSRPRAQQELLLARLRAIASDPTGYWDYTEQDSAGRDLGIHIFSKFAIWFWEDNADMHVKILEIHLAD